LCGVALRTARQKIAFLFNRAYNEPEVRKMAKAFVPKNKLSKKQRRELNGKSRVCWGFSPVTRKKENKKALEKNNPRNVGREDDFPGIFLPFIHRSFIFIRCFHPFFY